MGILDQALLQGDDSALHQELVNGRGITGSVDGGMNFLGNMFNAQTPLLWTASLIHDAEVDTDGVLEAFDAAVAPLRDAPLSAEAFERATTKMRSSFYDSLSSTVYPGFGRADLLASFALIDGDAARLNEMDGEIRRGHARTGASGRSRLPLSRWPSGLVDQPDSRSHRQRRRTGHEEASA